MSVPPRALPSTFERRQAALLLEGWTGVGRGEEEEEEEAATKRPVAAWSALTKKNKNNVVMQNRADVKKGE